MAYFLVYWKPVEAKKAMGRPLTGSWSNQYGRVHTGDTLWIISVLSNRLKLLGRQIVETKIEADPLEVTAREPFDYAIPIDIHRIAPALVFEGGVARLPVEFGPKNFQTIRRLSPESHRAIEKTWFRERGGERGSRPVASEVLDDELSEGVKQAALRSSAERRKRLAQASKRAPEISIYGRAFLRNPDVVAEVLCRAAGYCERCRAKAPFLRASDGTPYLEVHHAIQLAHGGEDTVENAVALCPNCHRELHYGVGDSE